MAKIKRSQFKMFLDTNPSGAASYQVIGDGVTEAGVQYNPEVTTETYVHQDGATITVERYAPNVPVTQKCNNGEAVFEFIDNLRRTRAIGTAAETNLLLVYLYETPTNTDNYPAEKQPCSIQIDSFGGPGGQTTEITYTINFRGDPTTGVYDVSANSFT
jgi:hypothetical protein